MLSLNPDRTLKTIVINKQDVMIILSQVFLIHKFEAIIIKDAVNSSLLYFYFYENYPRVFFSSFPFSMGSAGTITAYLVSAMLYTTVINIIITKTQRLQTVRHRKSSLQKKI